MWSCHVRGPGDRGWASGTLSLPLGVLAAVVLGTGYGLSLVAGLSEFARIAGPGEPAGLTAVFYSPAYLGFFVPMVLAWSRDAWSDGEMFGFGAVAAPHGIDQAPDRVAAS